MLVILTNISYFRRRRATLKHAGVLLASGWRFLAPPAEEKKDIEISTKQM